jgi:hypothetical protein
VHIQLAPLVNLGLGFPREMVGLGQPCREILVCPKRDGVVVDSVANATEDAGWWVGRGEHNHSQ